MAPPLGEAKPEWKAKITKQAQFFPSFGLL
jgi:hypothetical protein